MDPSYLLTTLRQAVASSVAGNDAIAVAYSGGLDSSVIAKLASERAAVACYCCASEDSADARDVAHHANDDRCNLETLLIDEDALPLLMSHASLAIGSTDPTRIAYSIPTIAVIDRCKERLILGGNGADEIFAGYQKYSRNPEIAEHLMAEDLEKSLDEALHISRYASSFRKDARFPFLRREVIETAKTIPLDEKIAGPTRKAILRDVARQLELVAADRPKKAAQYSSGFLRMMQRLARREGTELSSWTRTILAQQPTGKN